jgi:FlaA1/EpsC-like NDP-sugar epimerase
MPRFRNRYLLLADAGLLAIVLLSLFAIGLESSRLTDGYRRTALAFALVGIPVQLSVLLVFGMYRRLWRYASIREMEQVALAVVVAAIPTFVIGRYLLPMSGWAPLPVPLSVLLPYITLSVGVVALPRLFIRARGWHAESRRPHGSGRRVLVAGAGAAGELIVRELSRNQNLGMVPVAFVDDDIAKQRQALAGLPICGTLRDIPAIVRQYKIGEILIAMPTAPGAVIRSVMRAAGDVGVPTKIVPGLFEILSGKITVTGIRPLRIDDLLRRAPIETDLEAVASLARGRTVMVTGAGGSIGSELCRQLLGFGPTKLLLLGHSENPIFDIQNELLQAQSATEIIPVIADVRMKDRLFEIFAQHRPDAVFHAAAHKHVPLMEENPREAITNNVLGTRNVVEACARFAVEHMVMISTDKAVRPTNVMGASKRVAELVVANAARKQGRNFVSVRFGNVLGSQGSVVPIFTRQIREGGPITVTHPDMRRFFMTIPEAVQLVLQAAAQGKGGELFMLDMGEPVRILDLARDMIRLSGLHEGEDIEIQFSGVRPGEKLYEEMFFDHEIGEPTEHPKILRARNGVLEIASDPDIEAIIALAFDSATRPADLRNALRKLVPDYSPTGGAATPLDRIDPESMSEPQGEIWRAQQDALGDPLAGAAASIRVVPLH